MQTPHHGLYLPKGGVLQYFSSTSKHEISLLFLFLWVIFAFLHPDPDPATQTNADPCGSGSVNLKLRLRIFAKGFGGFRAGWVRDDPHHPGAGVQLRQLRVQRAGHLLPGHRAQVGELNCITVLLHNGGFCKNCTPKRCFHVHGMLPKVVEITI